jgi:ribosomal protein S18 acetylase RimI-like enzyme
VTADAAAMHGALEVAWQHLLGTIDGGRFERRGDLWVSVFPAIPVPQVNGPWVIEDSGHAIDGLPAALAEVEAAGAHPWVQTRSGHPRTRDAARRLGLTHEERLPGMLTRPGELVEPDAPAGFEIGLMRDDEVDATNRVLASAFAAPKELFDLFTAFLVELDGASTYVGRVDGEVVSTAVGFTAEGATGVFNVGTPAEHRGRGYGAALTARIVRDGFAAGSELAYLQSSDAGHGVYRRLGFRDVEEYVLLTRPLQ